MIVFESDKRKSLSFGVMVEGIQWSEMKFMFRMNINEVEYGFPGKIVNESIKFEIPPLSTIIKETIQGDHFASFDVIGKNKYFLNPWRGKIKLKTNPKVEVKLSEDVDVSNEMMDLDIKVVLNDEIDDSIDKKETTKVEEKETPKKEEVKPKSKFRMAIGD